MWTFSVILVGSKFKFIALKTMIGGRDVVLEWVGGLMTILVEM